MLHATRSASAARLALATALALATLLAWDASGLDLVVARWSGTPAGFPMRGDWFLVTVMHEGARFASWALIAGLAVAIRWPFGPLRRLAPGDRVQLAATVLASVVAVSLLKNSSETSCPWDLQVFGGVARHVSHWSWGVRDGGEGRCFPAGHASAAFAYAGGYFAWRRSSSALARVWLGVALALGLVLGAGQQLRGAHFTSHTLWTAWICWTVGFAIDALRHVLVAMRPASRLRMLPADRR